MKRESFPDVNMKRHIFSWYLINKIDDVIKFFQNVKVLLLIVFWLILSFVVKITFVDRITGFKIFAGTPGNWKKTTNIWIFQMYFNWKNYFFTYGTCAPSWWPSALFFTNFTRSSASSSSLPRYMVLWLLDPLSWYMPWTVPQQVFQTMPSPQASRISPLSGIIALGCLLSVGVWSHILHRSVILKKAKKFIVEVLVAVGDLLGVVCMSHCTSG